MAEKTFSSPALVKEIRRIYGKKAKTVKIPLQHATAVKNYLMKIEEGHRKAANSKLIFR